MYFLLGCIELYFNLELLKRSSLITKKDNTRFNFCYRTLTRYIIDKDSKKICEILNNIENYQSFCYNLLYTLIFVYVLVREVIKKEYVSFSYWFVANLSAFIFTMMGEIDIFKFSLSSGSNFSLLQLFIIFLIGIPIVFVVLRQIYFNKVHIILILKLLSIYLLILFLFLCVSNTIVFHFHHSLVSGLLTLCFTDFNSKFEMYFHAFFMSIFIQGFSFYSTSEILMLNISDISPPTFQFMIIVNFIFIFFWLILVLFKKYFCKNINNNNLEIDNLGMQLIPILNDYNV